MKETSGIYKITNKVNNKIYIGQSVHVHHRWREHYSEPSDGSLIDMAIKKYGKENFIFEVLEECSIDELNEKELHYSQLFPNCYTPKGYNIVLCGNSNRVTINFKQVSCYDLNGNKIKTFDCINDAARFYNIADTNIGECCKHRVGAITINNMYWEYGNQDNIVPIKPKTGKHGGKTVYQYDLTTGVYLQSFSSLANAERFLNKPGGNKNISAACLGKIKSAYGYKWSYEKRDIY